MIRSGSAILLCGIGLWLPVVVTARAVVLRRCGCTARVGIIC